ncbi:RagB/SusD family nutrient uptake outer membrane protein [Dyadobacter sp. OTU695]|uniref:RagB/SusD family nutrient uptake outer membrane protein n=1 Tax=Dyadobacter sp. OTU695 TaxID=3043860 RepID=UPI00313B2EA4
MKVIPYLTILAGFFLLSSCEDDFLQRNPQTAITKEEFFNTPADLETYTNGLYGSLGASWEDLYSDNISINTGGNETDNLIRGGITPGNVGGWNTWGELRRINYMLDNTSKTTGDAAVINHYIGVARFFRALFYYRMVKRYGDVPWYSHVMGTEDEEMLYKARDPRVLVVDSVMNDLEFAAAHVLPARTNKTMITRWAALALLSKVALHEGTYRTYHDELGLKGTASRFLERAVSASQKIIEEGGFEIHNTGNGAVDFRTLFSSNNLSANKEVIFLQKNSKEDGVANNTHVVLDWQWALSGSLANEFLMKDGTAFTSQAGYDKKTFTEVFRNRDPRMAETIMPPGFSNVPATNAPYVIKPSFGGYLQLKFYPRDPALRGGWALNYTDLPIFRYAEILLIHAEAKAELGTITQGDLDKTINLLRRRVGMPDLNLAAANALPDPYLAGRYPAVAGAGKGLILEIRRERRTEMACEGLRFDDLYRWKSGALLGQDTRGIYVPALGGIDVTGDGVEDIAILKAAGDEAPLAGLPADVKAKIVKYYLTDGSFYLSQGTSGHIMFGRDKQQPRNFNESKYYYFPVPLEQTILNKNLKQSPGWE